MVFLWCATAALRGKSCLGQTLETKKAQHHCCIKQIPLFADFMAHIEQKPPYQNKCSTTYLEPIKNDCKMTFKLRLSRYSASQVNCESRMPTLKKFSASVPPPTPSCFINKVI